MEDLNRRRLFTCVYKSNVDFLELCL